MLDNSYRIERWSNAAGGKVSVSTFTDRAAAQEAAEAMIGLGHLDTVLVATELDTTDGALKWSLDYQTLNLLPTLESDAPWDLKVTYDGGEIDTESTELAIRSWTGQKVWIDAAEQKVRHQYFDRNGNLVSEVTYLNGLPVDVWPS